MADPVDQKARDMAGSALEKVAHVEAGLDAHLVHCAERHGEVHKRIDAVANKINWIMVFTITTLVSVISLLVQTMTNGGN